MNTFLQSICTEGREERKELPLALSITAMRMLSDLQITETSLRPSRPSVQTQAIAASQYRARLSDLFIEA